MRQCPKTKKDHLRRLLSIAELGKTKEVSVHTSCMEQFASMVGLLVKGLVENFGEKGRMIAEKAALESGMFCAKRSIEATGIIERGTKALAKHVYPETDSQQCWIDVFEMKHLTLDDRNFELKVTRCPVVEICKAIGAVPAVPSICDIINNADAGYGKVYNPKLKFSMLKSMARGDEYCIYSWTEE